MFENLGFVFFVVLCLSLLLTPLSSVLAGWIGAVDHPVDRSVHASAVPRLGGLSMACAILITLWIFSSLNLVILGFLAGFSFIVITGVVDDVWGVRPCYKLLCQVIATVLFIEITGEKLSSIGDVVGLGEIVFSGWVEYVVTVFCFVGIINAFNLIDGLDGLVAGIVAIMCVFLGILALQIQVADALFILVAILGSSLGFLKFNSYPASLFMGDTGSMMLGFSMAAVMLIILNADSQVAVSPVSIAIILSLPLFDTLWVMFRRFFSGKGISSPDKSHVHHRLLSVGLSHSIVVKTLYMLVVFLGCLALVTQNIQEYWQFFLALSCLILCYILLHVIELKKSTSKVDYK